MRARLALAALFLGTPAVLGDFWLSVLVFAGLFAVAALGLSLLTGYAGQVSLGHAFFLGLGAYVGVVLGAEQGLPIAVWLPAAALAGALAGAAFTPFAVRLRGIYLAIATVGLVFLGVHLWTNAESLTGGPAGIGGVAPAALGPLDFNDLRLAGQAYSRNQSWFWLVWALVAVAAFVVRNVSASRAGRAMRAVRDDEVRAAILGVDVARTKRAAFALSSALAAVAGALYFGYVQYVSPDQWHLLLSVQFLAALIVGGIGTWWGAIAGSLVLGGLPRVVERLSAELPSLASIGLTAAQLNQLLLGALIVAFLVFQPEGVAGAWARTRRRRRRPVQAAERSAGGAAGMASGV